MSQDAHLPIEDMELFRRFVGISDWAWATVLRWSPLARDTFGKQLIRACDSIGANLVEGDGRYADADSIHFFVIARASARETRFWLQRAMNRGVLEHTEGAKQLAELISATQLLNRLITYRRKRGRATRVQESPPVAYDADPINPRADEIEE